MLGNAFDIGLWTILFWIFIGLALGGLLSWLLGSNTSTTTATAGGGALGLAGLADRDVTVRESRTLAADQLEAIEGVGPQIAEIFHKNGIHTFGQVAAMAPADISTLLAAAGPAFAIARPHTWPFQARLLENGWFAEFLAVGQRLRAGRLPLDGLDGIGGATAERLVAGGIGSVESLAELEPAAAVAKLGDAGVTGIGESRLAGWIAGARSIMGGDMAALAAFFGLSAANLGPRPAATYVADREVTGRLANPQALVGALPAAAAATATGGPSLLPLWLGLGGAGLLALLCALGVWCPGKKAVTAQTTTTTTSQVIESVSSAAAAPVPQNYSRAVAFLTDLGTDALFDTNKFDLKPEGAAAIDKRLFEEANFKPQLIRIVGHADVRGDDAANLLLSKNRANTVAAHIREAIATRHPDWSNVAIQAFGAGEEYPDPAADTAAKCAALDPATPQANDCYAPDRRVNVAMLVGLDKAGAEAVSVAADAAK